jgi:endonuclease-3
LIKPTNQECQLHVDEIFETLHKHNPNPKTELEYKNDFTLLIAVVLSARATDISVNKATKDLFPYYDSPQKILELGLAGLKNYIKTIGLYNTKAENIIKLCQILIDKYNSKVPNNLEELVKLPGVGRKTANVVLNCLFGVDAMPVDTHVFRVSRRLGLAYGNSPEKVERELLAIIPKKWQKYAHHWLVLHGRYICKARSPKCHECYLSKYCRYYNTKLFINNTK